MLRQLRWTYGLHRWPTGKSVQSLAIKLNHLMKTIANYNNLV